MSGKTLGAGFGLVLAFGAGALLIWNESRAVSVADSLWLGEKDVRIVAAERVDPANEGKLVFLRGAARGAPIVDPETGVTLDALAATRKVEMYQWREQSTRRGGPAGATPESPGVTLTKTWSERSEPTTVFMQAQRLANPPPPFGERRMTAEGARLGAFGLTAEALAALPKSSAAVEPRGSIAGRPAMRIGDSLFVGARAQSPEIGDLRIAYQVAPAGEISLVGRQVEGRIAAHRDAAGETILLAARGLRSPEDMFGAARSGNAFMTWVTRILGALAMWGGFALILSRLTMLGAAIPVIGGLLAGGSRAVAFAAAALVSGLVIAGGWLIARPAMLALVAAAAVAGLALLRHRRRPAPTPYASGAAAAARIPQREERR